MGGGEGEPDRATAAKQVCCVRRRLVVAERPQRRLRGGDRRRPQEEVEGDHVAIGEAQCPPERHRSSNTTRSEGNARGPSNWTAMTKTATKTGAQLKSLSEYIQERFDEFS